ncbi:MAG: hypothetical protein CMC04_05565 [Flavobacteriaceae bacterium]|nr:hypothetical protein [Flavobacteriaceae bacterium]MAH82807.1 hypothetical protein [Flavobacteriaceae bacterium]MBQ23098.1 hypothetical protein [Flavobacteriales bacterium]
MKKQPNKWLLFSGLVFQIGILIYIMIHLGLWIESQISLKNKLPTIICLVIGMLIIIYMIRKKSKNFY